MLELSKHFCERWMKRVGSVPPDLQCIERMIREATRVQKFKEARTIEGRKLRVLALYWIDEPSVILKVDEGRNRVVTVVTPKERWTDIEN